MNNSYTSHRLSGQITQIFDVNATEQMSKADEKGDDNEPQPRLSIEQAEQIMVIDDVLATGGTLQAAIQLSQEAGYSVEDVAVLIDLKFLNQFRFKSREVHSLVQY